MLDKIRDVINSYSFFKIKKWISQKTSYKISKNFIKMKKAAK